MRFFLSLSRKKKQKAWAEALTRKKRFSANLLGLSRGMLQKTQSVGLFFCLNKNLLLYRIRNKSLSQNKIKNIIWLWKINESFNGESVYHNVSGKCVKFSTSGIVDKVVVSKNTDNLRSAKVRIRKNKMSILYLKIYFKPSSNKMFMNYLNLIFWLLKHD